MYAFTKAMSYSQKEMNQTCKHKKEVLLARIRWAENFVKNDKYGPLLGQLYLIQKWKKLVNTIK